MKKLILFGMLFFNVHAMALGNNGWFVNEVYSNQAGTVQYIEFNYIDTAQLDIVGTQITITDDFTTKEIIIPFAVTEPTQFLISDQGFVQSVGSVQPLFTVAGPLFDVNSTTLSIAFGFDPPFVIDPLILPDDEFLALNRNLEFVPNSPTNNAGEVGQLPEPPLFFDGFEFCKKPIVQYSDNDVDGFGNPFNAISSCQLEAGYVVDNSDCNDTNNNVFPGNEDLPDLNFIDSNCDGIDGDVTDSVFLAVGGNGSGLGADDPIGSPDAAFQLALDQNKSWVLMAAGNFSYGDEFNNALPVGVNLAGSYVNAFQNRIQAIETTLDVPYQGLQLELSLEPHTYQYLRINSADDAPLLTSSYALTVRDVDQIRLEKVALNSGNGGNGTRGSNGTNGAVGVNGTAGGDGVESDGFGCASGSRPTVGQAGNASCSIFIGGGTGGLSGLGENNGFPGGDGLSGGGDGGAAGVGNGSQNTRNGRDADGGSPGGPGSNGEPASNAIEFVNSNYVITVGETGSNGANGLGGGGGGGGGGGAFACDSYGGAGGGGGSGGCGGSGSEGGMSGGASIGLRLVNSNATVNQSNINNALGGAGGDGGSPGTGGRGGFGRPGGDAEDDSGSGGDGGDGGRGGDGGTGGGGAGGAAIGIVCLDSSTLNLDQDTQFDSQGPAVGGSPGNNIGQQLDTFACD
ncbi:hypothetical protein OS175_08130 [Marinicella sp. S1101]|uniref:hypothetical protein n=1 Tax=Marinicella marina TaxID=2996016 RepID=UPI002260D189|nr:hypothetical protein [Marinicella marina]MCX7553843.1 hypothetical protein [Marinicella marina]MDJ1140919.1 hypothetical protein [Marinicella marina]